MLRWTRNLALLSLGLAAVPLAHADDNVGEYGGYVSNEEERFKGYVWDFLEEIGNDCSGICTDLTSSWINEYYTRKQYLWGSCSHLLGSSLSYVDSVDLAYVAGHGSASSIKMSSSEGSCDLSNASWGRYSTRGAGDLESIVLHSCKVLQMDSKWRERWMRSSASQARPFSGLHHAMGFTSNHDNGLGAGAWTSDELAENLEDGMSMRESWYEAVEDGYWLSPDAVILEGDNKQAVFYIVPNRDETMNQLYNNGAGDFNYGNSKYQLAAYYRQ